MPKKTKTKPALGSKGLETGTVKRGSKDAEDRFVAGYTKAVDVAARTIDGLASTINLDRDDEVILPSAFAARLDKFKAGNSPFMAAHTHRAATGEPTQVGWVMEISVSAADIPCKFRFATTNIGEQWWKLASDLEGKGIAFSIGFRPIRWVYGSVADLAREFPQLKPVFAAAGLADDDRVRVYTEIELYEISAVAVPSNREAMQVLAAKMAEVFGRDEADGEELLKAFGTKLADEVFARLADAPFGVTLEVVQKKIDQLMPTISELLVEQIDEIKARLPDNVNPDAPDSCPDPDDRGTDAAADKGAGTRAIAKKCAARLRE